MKQEALSSYDVAHSNKPRIFYLDYLRGFMILLVVLDHSMHGYTKHFADTWFIQDFERSQILDFFHLHNDAVMMPFMFFLAGLFVFPSLNRYGAFLYFKERFIRLGIPLLFGIIFIVPLLTYDKGIVLGTVNQGLLNFWTSVIFDFKSYPLDQATSAGFWFLTYLIILTVITVALYSALPWVRTAFKKYAHWIIEKPIYGILSIVGIVLILNLISDILWGGRFWFVVPPFLGLRKARFMAKAFFFIMGIALADAGFLKNPSIINRLKSTWGIWLSLALVILIVYAAYIFNFWHENLFSMPVAYYVHQFKVYPPLDIIWDMAKHEGAYACGRATILSILMVILSVFYLSLFSRFLNKPIPFWQSLAACSYGVYIVHEPLVTAINRYYLNDPLPAEFKFFMAALVSLGCSWLSVKYIFLKTPFLKRIIG